MATRYWKDQPSIIDSPSVESLTGVWIKEKYAKVYKDTESLLYYVTLGDIHGSQTALLRDADTVFKIFQYVKSKKHDKKLPDGVILLDNLTEPPKRGKVKTNAR
jgi:hypothetical protein